MIYKAKKREELYFSIELKSYVYKSEKISFDEAEKIKHRWAKRDLMDNAQIDEDFDPLMVEMFKSLVNNVSARELTARSQALTYHGLKRYVQCVFDFYTVSLKDKPLSKKKRPYKTPLLNEEESSWSDVQMVDNVFTFKGKPYLNRNFIQGMYKQITIEDLSKYAAKDDELAKLWDGTASTLLSNFCNVAELNDQLKQDTLKIYDYLKHIILTIDRYFDVKIKPETSTKSIVDKITGASRQIMVR